ncbi:unnamed protein product [Clavelina lepadiformis]|uniref:G-protein coupled receptors family 1 profile domain-containing protein n=1 Tax=Clavelina lepadiformis TaxID=159417 RepID=A0ABP0H383_CLALP
MALYPPKCEYIFAPWYLEMFNKIFNVTNSKEILLDSLDPCEDSIDYYLSNGFVYSLISVYALIIFIGLFGSLCVIWVIVTSPSLHKTLNFLLLSLAFSDVVLTLSLPWTLIYNISYDYTLGPGLCTAIPPIQGMAVMSSIYALLLMAVERYQVILHPHHRGLFKTPLRIGMLIAVVWVIAICFQIPQFIVLSEEVLHHDIVVLSSHSGIPEITYRETIQICSELWAGNQQSLAYSIAIFIFIYSAPLMVIVVVYARIGYFIWFRPSPVVVLSANGNERARSQRKKIMSMLILLASVFAVCWGPYFVTMLVCLDGHCNPELTSYFQWLGHTNVALDPILYAYLHVRVREEFLLKLKTIRRRITSWFTFRKLKRSNGIRRRHTVSVAYARSEQQQQTGTTPLMSNSRRTFRHVSFVTSQTNSPALNIRGSKFPELSTDITATITPNTNRKSVTFANQNNLPGMV